MNEIGNLLIRLKELSVEAANDVLKDEDRGMINAEYVGLRREIERQIKTTRMRGDQLLRPGEMDEKEFQIGTATDSNSKLVVRKKDLVISEFNMNIVDSDISTLEDARLNLRYIDDAIQKVASNRAKVGALQSTLQSTVNNLDVSTVNESAALSQRMDTDYAYETAVKLSSEQKLNAATSILAQANVSGTTALKLIGD